jgi:broad specificity phosphatase PhoE
VMAITQIFLIRHGHSIHNQQHLIAGQLDSALSQQGIQDAAIVANFIANESFDVVYSSDLGRARETANIVIKTLGLVCPLHLDRRLRELDYGEFTNRPIDEARHYLNYRLSPETRYPGGECLIDMEARVRDFLTLLWAECAGKKLLIVSHVGPTRVLLGLLDPKQRQAHLLGSYGNRFLCKLKINEDHSLASYCLIPDCGDEECESQEFIAENNY